MEPAFLALHAAVLAAAALQSATGIGFGIIAGPIMLVLLNDAAAIHISILLNLLIAVSLTPALWRKVDKVLLGRLAIGLLVGTPVGVWLFLSMDVVLLKIAAALAVLLTMALMTRRRAVSQTSVPVTTGSAEGGTIGAIAGVMGGSLGIPGPVPAAWMSARDYGKGAIRATILAMFVISYAMSLALQLGAAGIERDSLTLAVSLAPATLVGIVIGRRLHDHITEQSFRLALFAVLGTTVVLLLATLRA
jgi:uncharacterized membrane protein YfcA